MTGMAEMNPDLVGPSGFELAGQQRGDRFAVPAFKAFQQFPMGDGFATALTNRHLFPCVGMPIDRLVDGAARAIRRAPYKRHVTTLHRAGATVVGELCAQRLVSAVVL